MSDQSRYAEGYEAARAQGADHTADWLVGMLQSTVNQMAIDLDFLVEVDPYLVGQVRGFSDLLKWLVVAS